MTRHIRIRIRRPSALTIGDWLSFAFMCGGMVLALHALAAIDQWLLAAVLFVGAMFATREHALHEGRREKLIALELAEDLLKRQQQELRMHRSTEQRRLVLDTQDQRHVHQRPDGKIITTIVVNLN